jgi:hypothetical protein
MFFINQHIMLFPLTKLGWIQKSLSAWRADICFSEKGWMKLVSGGREKRQKFVYSTKYYIKQ